MTRIALSRCVSFQRQVREFCLMDATCDARIIVSRWQSSGAVEGRDWSRVLLAPGRVWCCTSAKAFAIASLSRRCHWCNRLCLYLAVFNRFHLQPSRRQKNKGILDENCLDRQLRLLVDSLLAEHVLCATLALFTLVTSALPVVFVSLSTTVNNRAFLTVFGKTQFPPRGVIWLEALSHLWREKQSSSISQYESDMAPLPFSHCTHH